MKPWNEGDLLCVLSGRGEALTSFQWFYHGKTISRRLKRTENGNEAFRWLKKNAQEIGFLFEDCTLRTVTRDFYRKHFIK